MAIAKHVINVLDPAEGVDFFDRVILAHKVGLAITNGTNPTLAVTFTDGLPQNYSVFVACNQSLVPFITAKTSTGFTVNLTGTASGGTCTIDVLVVAA